MNLCGGITSISEQDLLLQVPDDEFDTTPRKKKSSSASSSSRRNKHSPDPPLERPWNNHASSSSRSKSLHTRTTVVSGSDVAQTSSCRQHRSISPSRLEDGADTEPATFLNPVSRDDMKKLRSRQRNNPMWGRKTSSIFMKKIDSGFNLTWLDRGPNGQAVNLSTNSDKSSLRIRTRSNRNEDDNENDGSKLNQGEIRLKIRHIAKVGSDKERLGSSDLNEEEGPHKSTSYFVIKMKQPVGEWTKFKFVAQSLAERDTIVLAIRSLIDQEKSPGDGRTRRAISLHDRLKSDDRDDSIEIDSRRHEQSKETRQDNSRNNDPREYSTRSSRGIDEKFHSKHSSKSAVDSAKEDGNSQRISRRKIEAMKVTSILSQNDEQDDDLGTGSSEKEKYELERHSGKTLQHEERKRFFIDEMKESLLYEAFACNPIGCQSQALAAVEDGEIANLAASQLTGPWCTDDVCSTGLSGFADSMKGIFDLEDASKNGVSATGEKQRAMAEEYLSGFLGSNGGMSELLSVNDLWTIAEKGKPKAKLLRTKKLINRARNADAKAIRLKGLRSQMTFDASNVATTMPFIQTTSSFDDVKRSGRWRRRPESKALEIAGQFDSSSFLDKDVNEFHGSEDFEHLYYDSDPEDARERTLRRGPRRAIAEREKLIDEKSQPRRREALDILGSSRFGLGRKWRRLDEEVVLDIIEATKNEKLTLKWHPTQTTENSDRPTVICVKLWVEAGIYLVDGTFLLPKLAWLPAHENNLHSRVLNTAEDVPGFLDLLDVCRVKECESIDRNLHPFALVDRSFEIVTQNGRHLFETQSKQERGRIVNGLKLTIARLASLLMLRDLRAVDEFFGGNNSVPGEAPAWARSGKSGSSSEVVPKNS